MKNTKNNLDELSNKYIDLESELRLIQLRDPIKNIIDLFSNALNIPQIFPITIKSRKLKKQ